MHGHGHEVNRTVADTNLAHPGLDNSGIGPNNKCSCSNTIGDQRMGTGRMDSESKLCPHCHSPIPMPSEAVSAQLLACPRCGEPLARPTAIQATPSPAVLANGRSELPSLVKPAGEFPSGKAVILGLLAVLCLASYRYSPFLAVFGVVFMVPTAALWLWYFRTRRSNAATATFVLANMATMAGLGLSLALWTTSERREHDFKSKPRRQQREAPPANPTQVAALGYLPGGTNLVLAIDYSLAERTTAGREFLKHFHLGNTTIGPAELSKWTGLAPDEIDHAVLGIRTSEGPLPRLVLVAQARQSFDSRKLREKLKAVRSTQLGSKTVCHFTPEKSLVEFVIWFPAPDTVVVGLTRGDLEAVPDTPVPDGGRLAPAVQKILKERVSPTAQTWLAGQMDDWQNLKPWLALYLDKKAQDTLAGVRDYAFWLQFGDGVKLDGTIDCADAASAQKLEANLAKPGASLGTLWPVRFQGVVNEMSATLKAERNGDHLTLRAQASAEAVGPPAAP